LLHPQILELLDFLVVLLLRLVQLYYLLHPQILELLDFLELLDCPADLLLLRRLDRLDRREFRKDLCYQQDLRYLVDLMVHSVLGYLELQQLRLAH
jgi:hypothetical protein